MTRIDRKCAATVAVLFCLVIGAAMAGEVDMEAVKRFRDREIRYQEIAYKKLGEAVAKAHPKAKILLIKYKQVNGQEGNLVDNAQMAAFKKGLAGKAKIEVTRAVSSGMEDMMMDDDGVEADPEKMMEEMLTADKWNKFLVTHKKCTVVVSFAGLPPDYQNMKIWKVKDPKKRPAMVLANAYLYDLKFAFNPKFKFITAALAHKAVAFDPNQPVPKDEQKAFDSRFVMITPKSVDKFAKDNPDFFKKDKKDGEKTKGKEKMR